MLKAHANGPNIVGQQHPTLFGPTMLTCCVRLHGTTTMLALVAYSLKPVILLGPCKRTQHCWPTTPNNVGKCWPLLRPFAWAFKFTKPAEYWLQNKKSNWNSFQNSLASTFQMNYSTRFYYYRVNYHLFRLREKFHTKTKMDCTCGDCTDIDHRVVALCKWRKATFQSWPLNSKQPKG